MNQFEAILELDDFSIHLFGERLGAAAIPEYVEANAVLFGERVVDALEEIGRSGAIPSTAQSEIVRRAEVTGTVPDQVRSSSPTSP